MRHLTAALQQLHSNVDLRANSWPMILVYVGDRGTIAIQHASDRRHGFDVARYAGEGVTGEPLDVVYATTPVAVIRVVERLAGGDECDAICATCGHRPALDDWACLCAECALETARETE